eukprot:EG_transcript_45086
MSMRQLTLSFKPRAKVPQVAGQGAEVILATDANEEVVLPPAHPPVVEQESRRTLTADAKLEIIKYRAAHSERQTMEQYPEIKDSSQLRKWVRQEKVIRKQCANGGGKRKRSRGFQMYKYMADLVHKFFISIRDGQGAVSR